MKSALKVEFLPYTEEMLPELRDIYAHYVEHSTATFHIAEPTLDLMRGLLSPPTARHYSCAVICDGQTSGYLVLGRFKPREAYDDTAEVTVYLKEGFTGRGIGPLALAHAEGMAAERGFHALVAGISGENQASMKLFERSGYEKCAHFRQIGKKFGRYLDVVYYQKLVGGGAR